jgi:hypothetical protein
VFLVARFYNSHIASYGTRCKILYLLCKRLKKRVSKKLQKIVREAEKMLEDNYNGNLTEYFFIKNTEYCEVNINVINDVIKFTVNNKNVSIENILYNLVCIIKYTVSGLPTLTSELSLKDLKNFTTLMDFSFLKTTESFVSRLMSIILLGKSKECKSQMKSIIKIFNCSPELQKFRFK